MHNDSLDRMKRKDNRLVNSEKTVRELLLEDIDKTITYCNPLAEARRETRKAIGRNTRVSKTIARRTGKIVTENNGINTEDLITKELLQAIMTKEELATRLEMSVERLDEIIQGKSLNNLAQLRILKEINPNKYEEKYLKSKICKDAFRTAGECDYLKEQRTSLRPTQLVNNSEKAKDKQEKSVSMKKLMENELKQVTMTKSDLSRKANLTIDEIDKVMEAAPINNLEQLRLLNDVNPDKYSKRYLRLKAIKEAFNKA